MENENNMATFLGYEDVELSRLVNGKKKVKVKCLPVRKLAEYAALISLEPEIIELCTELTPEEVDMLSADDSGKLFDKAHELNFNPFSEWLKRKGKAVRMKAQAYGMALPEEAKTDGETSANS